jgi:hypothetical protein
VLPLIGCAGNVVAPGQGVSATPAAIAEQPSYYSPAPQVYAVGPATPAAVLVMLPGADGLARDRALWAAQGFGVVMPPPGDLVRLVADQQAAVERLLASARTLANAPIWVIGPGPLIDAALAAPQFGRGVSGVVMTSVSSGNGSCSESFLYEDSGTGAPPKVELRRSGDCGAGMSPHGGRQPSAFPAPAAPRPNPPRLIEASAVGKNLPPAAKAHRLAEPIKSASPS